MDNQTPTNEKLTQVAEEQRKTLFNKNEYIEKSGYGKNHPNALYEGGNDINGRGVNENGEPGNSNDIKFREEMIKKNRYQKNNGYGLGHPDTVYEGVGDDRGRSPSSDEVGNHTDVKIRTDNKKKNTYNDGNRYPNF